MVIDSNLDRFLSNSNKNLQVINNTQLNGYAEKNQINFNDQPSNQLNQMNQHNHTNNCLNQHNHHNHIRGECNLISNTKNLKDNSLVDPKMNNPNAFNDKTNLVQKNNLLKDSNQSINLPILHHQTKPSDDSEDENDDILEISPCGRWSKRRDQVEQHDIPNLDNSYLAIDGEEGLEVVWNEVRISERKNLQSNEPRIHKVFNRLIQLNHNNIVHIHKYWIDKDNPRLIFITEYMSGGTLRLFLKKTRSNLIQIKMTLMSWRRWCTQILCALNYLHSQKPRPIIHANLSCDTIFISHTGLVKIGCVCPADIHQNVKTLGSNTMANFYLLAPEIINENTTEEQINDLNDNIFNKAHSTAIDIYAFGIVALEMAVLGIKNNFHSNNIKSTNQQHNHQQPVHPYGGRYSDGCINQTYNNYISELSGSSVSRETIRKAIDLLDNDLQKDFINRCLNEDPRKRPTAKELLFHPIIFEVPCLKVICANKILNNSSTGYSLEQIEDEFNKRMQNTQSIIAEIHHRDGSNKVRRICDLSKLNTEYLEKFFEEVRNGLYPLYAFCTQKTKISKFLKMKRNSFKSIVENNNVNLNPIRDTMNGSKENLNRPLCKDIDSDKEQLINDNQNELKNNHQESSDQTNDVGNDHDEEEDEYDQEEEEDTGSQNEDYENRCENCSTDFYEEETRRIEQIEITLKSTTGQSIIKDDKLYSLDLNQEIIILLKLDDKMNRKLSCPLSSTSDNGTVLANELVTNGFINSKDRDLVEEKVNEALSNQNLNFTNLTESQPTSF